LEPSAARTPLWPLITAIGTISVVGLATGVTLPLVSLRLSQAHATASMIAALAALPAVGTLTISVLLSALTRAVGARAMLLAALTLSCASVLILATPYQLLPWALSRFAMGVATGILFALGETRILEIAHGQVRGRWTGAYATSLTACQLTGPALLALLGPQSQLPVFVAAAMHVLAFALLASDRWPDTAAVAERMMSWRERLRGSLPLAVAVLFFAMFDSTVLSLLPLYGLGLGLPARVAVLMVSVVLLGDTFLQVPLGWAADRLGRVRLHAVCGVLTLCAALCVPFIYSGSAATWIMLFVMGGAAGALYTLAIVRIGDRFSGEQLIAANAFVGFLWGVGALAGPLIGSASMQVLKPHGLMLFVAAGAALVLLSMLDRDAQEAERTRTASARPDAVPR
jgi:MFS family permease